MRYIPRPGHSSVPCFCTRNFSIWKARTGSRTVSFRQVRFLCHSKVGTSKVEFEFRHFPMTKRVVASLLSTSIRDVLSEISGLVVGSSYRCVVLVFACFIILRCSSPGRSDLYIYIKKKKHIVIVATCCVPRVI